MSINPNIPNSAHIHKHLHPERAVKRETPSITPEKRKQIREKILDSSDATPISQKQFALMFGDAFIQGTGLEGGNSMIVANYYENEIEQWAKGAPFSPSIQSKGAEAFKKSLALYQRAENAIAAKNLSELKHLVQEALTKDGHIVLPANVRGKPGLPGHTFSVAIERSPSGKLLFYFLNKGEGSELHPLVKVSALGKPYVSYRSPSFVLGEKVDFDEENRDGGLFLSQLIDFFHLIPSSTDAYHISSLDLYNHLQAFADLSASQELWKQDPSSTAQTDDMGVTSQRSGICPEAAIRLLMKEAYKKAGESHQAMKKTLYLHKMRGLRNGLLTLPLENNQTGKINLGLLKQAAKGFAVETDKWIEAGLLNSEEAAQALVLIEEVYSTIEKLKKDWQGKIVIPLEASYTLIADSSIEGMSATLPEISEPDPISTVTMPYSHHSKTIDAAIQNPNQIPALFNELGDGSFSNFFPSEVRKYTFKLLLALPVPQRDPDPFWSQTKPESALEIIYRIYTQLAVELISEDASTPLSEIRLGLYQAAAIAHKLLSLHPELKGIMDHYSIPLEHQIRHRDYFYPDAHLASMDANLRAYFANTEKEKSVPLITQSMFGGTKIEPEIEEVLRGNIRHSEWSGTISLINELIVLFQIETDDVKTTIINILTGNIPLPFMDAKYKIIQSINRLHNLLMTAQHIDSFHNKPLSMPRFTCDRGKEARFSAQFSQGKNLDLPLNEVKSTPKTLQEPIEMTKQPLRDAEALIKSHNDADGDAIEELLRIRGSEHFRAPLLILWCKQHPLQLEKESYRNYLMTALFLPGVIEKTYLQTPEQIEELRGFIDASIKKALEKEIDPSLGLFWLTFSGLLESRLHKMKETMSLNRLQSLPQIASSFIDPTNTGPEISLNAAYSALGLLSLQAPLNDTQCRLWIQLCIEICFLKESASFTPPLWIQEAIQRISFGNKKELEVALTEFPLARVRERLLLAPEVEAKCGFPKLSIGGIGLDLLQGTIRKGELVAKSVDLNEMISCPEPLRKLAIGCMGNPMIGFKTYSAFEAQDGSLHLFEVDWWKRLWALDMTFKIGGNQEKYRALPADFSINGLPKSLEKSIKLVSHQNPNQIILLDEFYQPAYLLRLDCDPLHQLEKISQGSPTGEYLIPGLLPSFESLFAKLASPESISILYKDRAGSLVPARINLGHISVVPEVENNQFHFKIEGFPNSYLSEMQGQDPHFVGRALWIEDTSGQEKRMILLPQRLEESYKNESLGETFSRAIDEDLKQKRASLSKEYPFIYRINPQTGIPKGESTAADIYLTALYLEQDRYQEAMKLLSTIQFHQSPTDAELALFEILISHPRMSPEACAIKLHAFVLLQSTSKLLTKKSKARTTPINDLITRLQNKRIIERNALHYQTLLGSENIQRISDEIRLSHAELKELNLLKESINHTYTPYAVIANAEKGLSGAFTSSYTSQSIKENINYELIRTLWNRILNDTEDNIEIDLAILELKRNPASFAEDLSKLFLLYRKTKSAWLKSQLNYLLASPFNLEACRDSYFGSPYSMKSYYEELKKWALQVNPLQVSPKSPQPPSAKEASIPSFPMPTPPLYQSPAKAGPPPDTPYRFQDSAKPFSIGQTSYQPVSPMARTLMNDLNEAHQSNLKETFNVHHRFSDTLASDTRKIQKQLEKDALIALKTLEQLANYPNDAEFSSLTETQKAEVLRYRIKQGGEQTQPLTLRDPLLRALLMGSSEAIGERNPFLSPQQIEEIREQTIHYLDLMNAVQRLKSANDLLIQSEKGNNALYSQAVDLLNQSRTYDPNKFPELALYEYATGMQLRPSQVEILDWIFTHLDDKEAEKKLSQLAFEFQAGGGKTKVISAILAAKALALGKVPIFFSLPHLFDVTQDDLKGALSDVFDLKLSVVEFSLQDSINETDIRAVINLVQEALDKKKVLFMSPETWHVINLTMKKELPRPMRDRPEQTEESPLRRACEELFDLLKSKGFALVDEAHLNAESLQQTNRASGKTSRIPVNERKIFAKIARFLIDDPELNSLSHFAENNQTTMPLGNLQRVKERITELLLDQFQNEIPPEAFDELKTYWLDKDCDYPPFLLNMSSQDKTENIHQQMLLKRIDLIRGILNTILPFAIENSKGLDYVRSTKSQVEVWVPAKQGVSSGAHFQNPDVSALLTSLGTFQSGLTQEQCAYAVNNFCETFDRESRLRNSLQSKIGKRFDQMQESSAVPKKFRFTLKKFNEASLVERKRMLEALYPFIHKNSELIEHHLIDKVLPQIAIFSDKEQSTATELVRAFSTSVLFSATLGAHEKYALQKDPDQLHRRDLQFMDQVITRACLPHHGHMHWIPDMTPNHVLDKLGNEEFSTCEGIINVGAYAETATNEEWADAFLRRAKQDGIDKKAAIFFRKSDTGERSLWLKKDSGELIPISGSNVKALLKDHSLRIDQVYKIFGPSETTGTDLPISPSGRMLMTVGDNVNLSLAVQSIMRMREFLKDPIDPHHAQQILWIGTPEFKEKIRELIPQNEIGPREFFAWALEKEAHIDESAILQQAVQEIDAIILEHVENDRRGAAHYYKETKAYTQNMKRDPSSSYGGVNSPISTQLWLSRYARTAAARSGVGLDQSITHYGDRINKPRLKRIQKTIERTAEIIPQTTQRENAALNGKIEQKTEESEIQQVREEQRTRQKEKTANANLLNPQPEMDYHDTSLYKGPISEVFKDHLFKADERFSPFFSDDLYFFTNAVCAARFEPEPTLIKEVDFFLVEEIKGEKRAYVLSGYDAEQFLQQLSTTPQESTTQKKLCLFTSTGDVAKNGTSSGGFTESDLLEFRTSPWFKEKINEIGLWNGKVMDIPWMERKLQDPDPVKRAQTLQAWTFISSRHANQAHIQRTLMNELIAGPIPVSAVLLDGDLLGANEYDLSTTLTVAQQLERAATPEYPPDEKVISVPKKVKTPPPPPPEEFDDGDWRFFQTLVFDEPPKPKELSAEEKAVIIRVNHENALLKHTRMLERIDNLKKIEELLIRNDELAKLLKSPMPNDGSPANAHNRYIYFKKESTKYIKMFLADLSFESSIPAQDDEAFDSTINKMYGENWNSVTWDIDSLFGLLSSIDRLNEEGLQLKETIRKTLYEWPLDPTVRQEKYASKQEG